MKNHFSKSRRELLRNSALGLGAVAVAGLVPWTRSRAQDLPRVSEDSETAQGLEYVHDATTSSARENGDAFCHNCRYFKGDKNTEWAGCDLFPGEAVNSRGWCNVWAAK